MQARRNYVRSLLLPLALCSVALTLVAFAVWSGMYQSTDAAEAIQDVASLTNSDTTNHLLVAMLWFVPLTLILLVAVWVRRIRSRESDPTR
jgi:mannose/fructose/N-acetylgalactosamine-specific phosphotransferase system component IIC